MLIIDLQGFKKFSILHRRKYLMDFDLGEILSGVKIQKFLISLTITLYCCSQRTKQENFIIKKEEREQKRVRKEKKGSYI